MKKIAIIGAGLSGLTLGEKLSKKADIFIFEKARGVGGRMSTRHADPFVFDHGAQYWTAKKQEFKHFLEPLINSVVAEWKGRIVTLEKGNSNIKNISELSCFVATPHMNSLCKYLAIDLNILTHNEVINIKPTYNKKWRLIGGIDQDLGVYDIVISTAPAPQTLKLFSDYLPQNHEIHKAKFNSCFALLVGINNPWDRDWIAADIHGSHIKWIGVNSTKPGRNHDNTCLVIHADAEWTNANLQKDILEVQDLLLNELSTLTTLDIKNLSYVSTHRWLYSKVQPLNNQRHYIDLSSGLYAIGDWYENSDIETVWLNAQRAADFIASKI